MVRLSVRVSFYPMILLISLAGANEICRRSFYIDEDIDLFGELTEQLPKGSAPPHSHIQVDRVFLWVIVLWKIMPALSLVCVCRMRCSIVSACIVW